MHQAMRSNDEFLAVTNHCWSPTFRVLALTFHGLGIELCLGLGIDSVWPASGLGSGCVLSRHHVPFSLVRSLVCNLLVIVTWVYQVMNKVEMGPDLDDW